MPLSGTNVGIPPGGNAADVLTKTTGVDFDVEWAPGGIGTLLVPLTFRADGGGSIIAPGLLAYTRTNFVATILGWTLLSVSGNNMVLDIWKAPFVTNTPPTIGNTITAAHKPTLVAGVLEAGPPTGWTTAIAAGDVWAFHLDSGDVLDFTLSLSLSR